MTPKILFINFSFRDETDNFFPYGVYCLMTYLSKHGYDQNHFYNIDLHRPTREESVQHIVDQAPDILAISSPVSTGYESCKYYSLEVKKLLPNTTIILGGNLATSADIILQKTGVDFCFLGEGEKALLQFVQDYFPDKSLDSVKNLPGISYFNDKKVVINGYGEPLEKEIIYDIDVDLIDKPTIDHYFNKLNSINKDSMGYRYFFPEIKRDPILDNYEGDFLNKRTAVVLTSRGCVSRCTFCHRFVEGIRILPVSVIISRLKVLIDRFDIGAFHFSDECFGASRSWVLEFCKEIKPLNILWKVGGMKVSSVDPEVLALMYDSGCRSIICGMETGSESMLNIMEKKTSKNQGINAMKWMAEAGIFTVIQMVIGMPGEDAETFKSSEDTLKIIGGGHKDFDVSHISINFTQGLPGTPVYEYGRSQGLIGVSLDEEEQYLLKITDTDAADWSINYTNLTDQQLQYWKTRLEHVMKALYIKKFGILTYHKNILRIESWKDYKSYLSLRGMFKLFPNVLFMLKPLLWLIAMRRNMQQGVLFGTILSDQLLGSNKKKLAFVPKDKSLRKSLVQDIDWQFDGTPEMVQLRLGNTKETRYKGPINAR